MDQLWIAAMTSVAVVWLGSKPPGAGPGGEASNRRRMEYGSLG